MKELLFLLGRYYPRPSPNSICAEKIIDKLLEQGCRVTCISYEDFRKTEPSGVEVYKVNRGLLASLLYKLEGRQGAAPRLLQKLVSLLSKLKQLPFLLSWPWNDPVYTSRVWRLAKKLHRQKAFDAVVAVHMPLSSLIVAHKMKQEFPDINYIAYFLDSLSGGRPIRICSEKWNIQKKLKWEKRLLSNADHVVAMESSRKHHETYNKNQAFSSKIHYLDIPLLTPKAQNGAEGTDYLEPSKINVVFCGTANVPMRNIPYFLRLASLIKDARIRFTIIGESNFPELHARTGEGNVRYYPYVEHSKLIPVLQNADFLLNFGVRTPSAISGKIFEYMSYGKPIISTYSIDEEACIPYLQKYPLSLLLDEREEQMEKQAGALEAFLTSNYKRTVEVESILNLYYNNLPEAFLETVMDGGA